MTDKPFVTIEGVAEHFVVSVATVRTWLRNGTVSRDTYLKVGNTYRFDLPKLADALVNAPKKSAHLELDLGDQE